MKKVFLSLVLMFVSAVAYSQGVIGKWVTEGGDSQVEIYQNGDQLCGKIIWLKKGDGQLDVHNPDKSMQSRKLIGVNILTGSRRKVISTRVVRSTTLRTARPTNVLSGSKVTT